MTEKKRKEIGTFLPFKLRICFRFIKYLSIKKYTILFQYFGKEIIVSNSKLCNLF